jgi:sulfite exporter TauE/SafE/copper chaperone CopZ
MSIRHTVLSVNGMHCPSCENTIKTALGKLPGIQSVQASYEKSQVQASYDDTLTNEGAIVDLIVTTGYEVPATTSPIKIVTRKQITLPRILIFVGLLLLVGAVVSWGRGLMPSVMMQLSGELSYAMLFSIGFLTGFHCIGMCGSFVVSYADTARTAMGSALSHFAYGGGKTLSYATIGGAFGLLGGLITITPVMRGYAALFAGIFLLLFGLKMLNIIPALRILTLRLPAAFTRGVNTEIGKRKNPLVVGLLNGLLLGCGPLQAMYIMAAGTGSAIEGATMLAFFGLGTLPALLGFGFFASYLSSKTIHDLVRVSGLLVIMMGLMMANRGWVAIS